MNENKKSNSKTLWYILFAFVTVIMCYLFIVVYFYFISPYNISLKLAFWPFVPEHKIGEMYLDATVDVSFSGRDIYTLEEVDKSIVGVNVRENGFIVTPYDEIKACEDISQIKIKTNDGSVYDGKLLFADVDFNLAILKCEVVGEGGDEIHIPFVNVIDVSNVIYEGAEVIAVSSPIHEKNIWDGKIDTPDVSDVFKTIEVSNTLAVDFVIENCYSVQLVESGTEFSGGAVFDKAGNILGLSYKEKLDDGSHVIMPLDGVNLFLNQVISSYEKQETYKNDLVDAFVGFDQIELDCFQYVSRLNSNESAQKTFYFDNSFPGYSDDIIRFESSELPSYFLFKDFVWKEQIVLGKNEVVSALKIGGRTYKIETKVDLLEILYKANKNEKMTIYYYDVDQIGTNLLSISFTI